MSQDDWNALDLPPEIPLWGHPLGRSVHPIFVSRAGVLLRQVGTAFTVSHLGLVCTARHNFHDALRDHPNGDHLRQRHRMPPEFTLRHIGMVVLRHRIDGHEFRGVLQTFQRFAGTLPTDVLYCSSRFESSSPIEPLPLALTPPRTGERVVCVGYPDLSVPSEGIEEASIVADPVILSRALQGRMICRQGTVQAVFTQAVDGTFQGACFHVDVDVEHGMSGGPVLNSQNHVCGIVSFGWQRPEGTIAAALYPTLFTPVDVPISREGGARFESRRVLDLIRSGDIASDGSEGNVRIWDDNGGRRIGFETNGGLEGIYNDFRGMEEDQQAHTDTGGMRTDEV